MTDSILSSELFDMLLAKHKDSVPALVADLDRDYGINLFRCKEKVSEIIDQIPAEWNVPKDVIANKLNELFKPDWYERVWLNFMDCLSEKVNVWPGVH